LETGTEASGKSYIKFDKQAVYQTDALENETPVEEVTEATQEETAPAEEVFEEVQEAPVEETTEEKTEE
jgi:hypothetical protein